MFDFFNNVFSNLSDSESLWFMLFHLIAFLIGLVTGYFIWGRQVKRLKTHIEALGSRINLLEGKTNDLQAENKKQELLISALSNEVDLEKDKNKQLEDEKGDLHSELILVKAAATEKEEIIVNLNKEKDDINAKLDADAMSFKASMADLNADLDARTGNIGDLQTQIGSLEADLKAKTGTIGDLEAKIGDLEGINANLKTDLDGKINSLGELEAKLGELETDLAASLSTNNDLSAKIGNLEGSNANLSANLNASTGNLDGLEGKIAELEGMNAELTANLNTSTGNIYDLETKIAELEGLNTELSTNLNVNAGNLNDLKTHLGSLQVDLDASGNTNADLEAKVKDLEFVNGNLSNDLKSKVGTIAELETKIGNLESQIDSLMNVDEGMVMSRGVAARGVGEAPKLSKEEKAAAAAKAAEEVKELIGAYIPTATAADADDLKIINGIGGFIEEKLNKLGIYTYEQISYFDKKMVNTVTQAIQFFPGRIERDKWIPQARALSNRDISDVDKARAAIKKALGNQIPMATAAEADDLKIISGIGKFIEEKLNKLGIYTFEQISLFDDDFVGKVTKAIEFFPGRIQRDRWVAQAKALYTPKK